MQTCACTCERVCLANSTVGDMVDGGGVCVDVCACARLLFCFDSISVVLLRTIHILAGFDQSSSVSSGGVRTGLRGVSIRGILGAHGPERELHENDR